MTILLVWLALRGQPAVILSRRSFPSVDECVYAAQAYVAEADLPITAKCYPTRGV